MQKGSDTKSGINKMACALLGIGLTAAVLAGTDKQCLPMETVTALFVYGATEPTLHRQIPAHFPAIDIPSTMSFLGAVSHEGVHNTVALSTDLPAMEAQQDIVQGYIDSGWKSLDARFYAMGRGGFRSGDAPLRPVHLCHPQIGNLTITALPYQTRTHVKIRVHANSGANHCLRAQPSLPLLTPPGTSMSQYLPDLLLPDGSQVSTNAGLGGFSGSNNDITTTVRFQIELNAANILQHFAEQLSAQAWVSDGHWSSTHSNGSLWRRQGDGEPTMVGTLTLFTMSPGIYRAEFRIVKVRENQPLGSTVAVPLSVR